MTKHFREISVALALLLMLVTLRIVAPDFFRSGQILAILMAAMPVLIVGCGVSLVIVSRQIDISVGSQFALCSVILGVLIQSHWPIAIAGIASIFCGALMGALNGWLVAGLNLPSIVVTLATMVSWREALRWWREGEFVRNLPPVFQWFGLGQAAGQFLILFITAAVFILLLLGTKYLAAGRFIYAVGSDAEAARLAGLRPQAITFSVFVLTGCLAGLAALLNAVRFTDVDPRTGSGLELQTIAAAVVGGVAISGGRGNLWGLLVGVLLLSCIGPALVFLHWQPQWEKAIQGAIILLAVASDGWRTARMKLA